MSTDDDTIYIAPAESYDMYCYKFKEDVWSDCQNRCPQRNFGLVVFGNKLTAVGGRDASGCVTGKVLTLRQGKWIEELPPLTQPRSSPAVVSTNSHLLTIGGHTGDGWCSSVELLHRGDRAWTSLTSLPTTTHCPSATVIGEHIYIIANEIHSFFSSLADVLANKKPLPPITWQPIGVLPSGNSRGSTPSSCSLGGELVIVTWDGTIHQLLGGDWVECGRVSENARYFCLVSTPSPDTMVVIGGIQTDDERNVEVCTVE